MQPTNPDPDRKRFMHNAVGVAAWVWVVVTLLPIVLIVLCCAGCFGFSAIGAATTDPYSQYLNDQ